MSKVINIYLNKTARVIEFETKFETGKTFSLPAVRRKFVIQNQFSDVNSKWFSVDAIGQTAFGVGFFPDIDYSFNLTYSWGNGKNKWTISGCHDGYPAYRIRFSNNISSETKILYNFQHQKIDLEKLFGTCDIKVETEIEMVD